MPAAAAGAARLLAALPPGVRPEALQGPSWILPASDVVFEVGASGARRVLARTTDTVVYAGTLYDEPVAIEQAHPTSPDDINAWLARVRFQYGVRAEGVLPVYGTLVDVDSGGAPAFYTVAQRATSSVASAVLAADGTLARVGMVVRLRLAWQSAAALAALHARRIVHGAVTPANVLLSSTDEDDAAVRLVGYSTTGTAGTPGSAANDVHSWGMLAWCILAGTPTPAADGPPPMAALVERGVPPAVVDAIRECLAAEPEARPAMVAVARTLAAAYVNSRAAAAASVAASSSSAAARDAMLQLALKTTSKKATRALVFSGAGGGVAVTLQVFITDVVVVRAACTALRNLSKACSAAVATQLQNCGAGKALVAAVRAHARDTEVLRAACDSLYNLAEVESVCRLLVQCDGVGGALVAALHSDASDLAVARVVCITLQNLSVVPDQALALQLDGGGAAIIATLQRYTEDAEVANAACGALWNMAAVEANRYALAIGGAGAVVVAALQQHAGNSIVSQSGCTALRNLAISQASRKALLARDGTVVGAAVVAVLKQHADNASLAYSALCALWNICIETEYCTGIPLVNDHSAVAAIVAAAQLHSDDVDVARVVCGVLRQLAASTDTCELLGQNASFCAVVVAALQRNSSDVEVAAEGCWALCNVSRVESGRTLLAQDDNASACVEVVVDLLRHHVGNGAVVEAACSTLWALAESRTVQMALPQVEGAGAAVLAALQHHVASDANTVYAVTGVLRYLAGFSCLHAMLGPLTGEHAAALRGIMDAFPDKDLQLHCDDVLTLLR